MTEECCNQCGHDMSEIYEDPCRCQCALGDESIIYDPDYFFKKERAALILKEAILLIQHACYENGWTKIPDHYFNSFKNAVYSYQGIMNKKTNDK